MKLSRVYSLLLFGVVLGLGSGDVSAQYQKGTIDTVAGTGDYVGAYSGDGGPATQARLSSPYGVAVDGRGTVWLADTENQRIRKVTPDGMIQTAVGSSSQANPNALQSLLGGFAGDEGPATQALLNTPEHVAVDPQGDLYIADTENHRIRKVTPDGLIHTVAGNGVTRSNPNGGRAGDYSGDGGPAMQAQLNLPSSVAVDNAGNLFIADTYNARIRKVDRQGIITTIAGHPDGMNDEGDAALGFSGDNGPADQAQLNLPFDVALDNLGNLFIADSGNFRVRRVDAVGRITTVAGDGRQDFTGAGGLAVATGIGFPEGLVIDPLGDLFIATQAGYVLKVDPAGLLTVVAGGGMDSGNDIPATQSHLTYPWGLALDHRGNLYIAAREDHLVRRINLGNVPPTAADLTLEVPMGSSVGVTLSGTDLENDPLTYTVIQGPTHGQLTGTPPNLSYMPDPGYTGADQFTYTANDGFSDGPSASVNIAVRRFPGWLITLPATSPRHGAIHFGLPTDVKDPAFIVFTLTVPPTALGHRVVFGTPSAAPSFDVTTQPDNSSSDQSLQVQVHHVGTLPSGEVLSIPFDIPLAFEVGERIEAQLSGLHIVDSRGVEVPVDLPSPVSITFQLRRGDVNGDGRVTLGDATLALQIAVGSLLTVPGAYLWAGDVAPKKLDGSFGDGTVEINDAVRILRYAVGLDTDPWP